MACIVWVWPMSGGGAAAAERVRVFAAASLTSVLQAAAPAIRAETGLETTLAFAATSTLARQLAAGAEADVFISADARWMDWLVVRKLVAADSVRTIASNRLVVIAPADSPVPGVRDLDVRQTENWTRLVQHGRIAVGDPAHVPAGRYAKAALEAVKAWPIVAPRLVAADHVRNALALVERGEVAAGIVYATDARISTRVRVIATFPAALHPSIVYPAGLTAGPDLPAARTFLAWLDGPAGRALLQAHGFSTE